MTKGSATDYRVVEVRRIESMMLARQVEGVEHRTSERLLLLNEDQFDARLQMEATLAQLERGKPLKDRG